MGLRMPSKIWLDPKCLGSVTVQYIFVKYTVAIFFGGEVYQNIVFVYFQKHAVVTSSGYHGHRWFLFTTLGLWGHFRGLHFGPKLSTTKLYKVNPHNYNMYVHTITYIIDPYNISFIYPLFKKFFFGGVQEQTRTSIFFVCLFPLKINAHGFVLSFHMFLEEMFFFRLRSCEPHLFCSKTSARGGWSRRSAKPSGFLETWQCWPCWVSLPLQCCRLVAWRWP